MNYILISLIIAVSLDTILGDPYKIPHPIRLFGNLISFFESRLNLGDKRKFKGAVMWLVLLSSTFGFFYFADYMLSSYPIIHTIWIGIFTYFGLSNRCLIEEGIKVEKKAQTGDVVAARKQLSMIVGRDTDKLSLSQIRSSVIETLSENLSDGVVAPLFFWAIGGVPLMMCYKMINTLDSMVGYKNDKYLKFGFVSAKMDDIANYIPARITALLMVLVTLSRRGFKFIFKYGNSHSSPNSGYPESAIAGILDCRLGGANYYFGKEVIKPYIGENPRELQHNDIIKCCCVNGGVALVCYLMLAALLYLGLI
ncbi:MAG: adenosylcobinamide-phosphate synthase CbiB [Rikenellaceae bacterium]